MKERLILIYFLAFIRPLTCEVKIWTQSTSLGDPQQWEEERLPCLGQSIVLPEEVMFVPNQFKFGPETILPNDGMLLFQQGDNPILDKDVDMKEENCNFSSPARFRAQPYYHWYDPDNWRTFPDYQGAGNSPIPHLHRVPCRYDEANFPEMTAFKVMISDHPVSISRLIMNGIRIDSAGFRSIYSGGDGYSKKIGQMMIQMNESLTVFEDNCPNGNEGCVCGRDEREAKTICSMKGGSCSDYPKCSGALKPLDHCCYDICGAVIHIEKSWKSKFKPLDMIGLSRNLEQMLRPKVPVNPDPFFQDSDFMRKTSSGKSETATFDIRRVTPNSYQIVVVDKNGNIVNAQQAAQKMYEKISKDYQEFYIWTEFSGTSPPSALKKAGNVFGILFVFGIIGSLLYLVAVSYKKKQGSEFSVTNFVNNLAIRMNRPESLLSSAPMTSGFARFENESGAEIEMAGENPESSNGNSDPSLAISFQALQKRRDSFKNSDADDNGFANPLFGNPQILVEKRQKLEVEEEVKRMQQNIYSADPTSNSKSVDNPLYDVMVDITAEACKEPEMNEESIKVDEPPKEQPTEDSIYAEIKEPVETTGINDDNVENLDSHKNVTEETDKPKYDLEKTDKPNAEVEITDKPNAELSQFLEENAQKLESSAASDEKTGEVEDASKEQEEQESPEIDTNAEKPLVEF